MISSLIFAFTVGAVSSVNPCGFALLPAYFAHRLGVNTADAPSRVDALGLAAASGAAASAGFVIVFGIIGAVISLGAVWLIAALPWAGFLIGIVLMLIGVWVLAGKKVGLRLPAYFNVVPTKGFRGDLMFGVGYGTASLSCTLPIFLTVTGISLTGGLVQSLLGFVAFGLGMGAVLMAISVSAALSQQGMVRLFKKFLPYANRFSAVVLVLTGAYVIFYWGMILLTEDVPSPSSIIGVAEQVSGRLRIWLGGDIGLWVLPALAIIFTGVIARRWFSRRGSSEEFETK